MKHIFRLWPRKRRLSLRMRLALWSGGSTLLFSFVLLFFINVVALRSFPSIIRSTNPTVYNRVLHNQHHPQIFFGIFSGHFNPLEGALLRELQSLSLIGLGLTAIISGFCAYWLAGFALRPVKRVSSAAKQISANTLHTRLLVEEPQDEVRELAVTFNEMLGRLEYNFAQQSRFVADVAHELRTPLASLRTNMEVVVSDDCATMEDYREMTSAQERALTRLESLVSDLLLLARSESVIAPRAITLSPLIEEVFCDLTHEAERYQIALELINAGETVVQGNSALLIRVFSNLVANAIYYNRSGGKVQVSIDQKGEWAIVYVKDTGIGIDAEQQARIFDRFYRVDGSRTRHTGGAGLGLSIVAAIVQQHKGLVQVESAPGVGSTFTVMLPSSTDEYQT